MRTLWNVSDQEIRQRASTKRPQVIDAAEWRDIPAREYIIAPEARIEVDDQAADILLRHHERRGLVELRFGMTEEDIATARRKGRRNYFDYLKEIVGTHKMLNEAQRAKGLPTIPPNDHIQRAYWKYRQLADTEFQGGVSNLDVNPADVQREVEMRRDLLGQDAEVDALEERRLGSQREAERAAGFGA